MNNLYANKLNLINPLDGKLPLITEYFVKFYGEDKRERITNKLKNATFVFIPNFKIDVYLEAEKYFYNLKNQIQNNVVESTGFPYEKKLVSNLDLTKLSQLKQAYQNKNLTSTQKDMIYKLNDIFKQKRGTFSYENKNIIKMLNVLEEKYTSLYKEQYEELIIQEKTALAYFEKFQEKFDENKYLLKMRETTLKYFAKILKKDVSIIKTEPKINEYLDTFTSIIKNGPENFSNPLLRFKTIDDKRIELFKFLGFNHGDNYNKYLFDPNLHNAIFNKTYKNAIESIKNQKTHELNEYLMQNDFFFEANQKINNLNASFDDKLYLLKKVKNHMTFESNVDAFVEYYQDTQDKQLKTFCVFPPFL